MACNEEGLCLAGIAGFDATFGVGRQRRPRAKGVVRKASMGGKKVSACGILGRGRSVDTRQILEPWKRRDHVSWRVRVARGIQSVRSVFGSDAILETVAIAAIRHQHTVNTTKYHRVSFAHLRISVLDRFQLASPHIPPLHLDTMGPAPPNSQMAPLPTNLPFRLVSKTIGQGAYASYVVISPRRVLGVIRS